MNSVVIFSAKIKEYKEIDQLLIKFRSGANSSVRHLYMSKVHSYFTIKLSQLSLRLVHILIRHIDNNRYNKQKTFIKLSNLTGK